MLARLHKAMNKQEDEGFTLIELLVVIIIIGILAAIAIPVFLSQKSKGYEASMKSDLRTAAQDIESANVDAQDYRTVTWATKTLGTAGATDTITGSGTVGSDTVKLSNGNTLDVQAGTTVNSYCIEATSSKTSAKWYYSTAKGGISSSC
jgi:prepilin-type N-terminal cleavage/methylation domain-containing protein